MLEKRLSTKPRGRILCLFVLSIYLFTEGICYLSLLVLEKAFNYQYDPIVATLSEKQKDRLKNFLERKKGEHTGQDPVLGWVNVSETNSAGMRDSREYEAIPPRGIIRLSAFGDSFTFGSDVDLDDTWAKQLTVIDSSIEVLNYGSGAYGLDQAYLRYLKVGTEYNPHIVFIGYMSENIARNVNVFRAFYTHGYRNVIFTKPRFKVRGEKLVLLNNPLSTFEDYEHFLHNDKVVLAKLGENDYHYWINYNKGTFDFLPSVRFAKVSWYKLNKRVVNPIFKLNGMYSVESEAYNVTVKIFDAFYRKVLENGALPVIIIFPDTNDQLRSRKKKNRRYTPLLNNFRSKGYRYIDTLEALEPHESHYTVDVLVVKWGHYSPVGNKIIARYIFSQLKKWNFTNPSKLKETIKLERRRLGLAFQ